MGRFYNVAERYDFGEKSTRVSTIAYYKPGSPGDRCANVDPYGFYGGSRCTGQCAAGTYSAVPPDSRDAFWNNARIVKLQYQHNIGRTRTFASTGIRSTRIGCRRARSARDAFYGFGVTSYDYELESHTRGLAFTFADQLNTQRLFDVDANYTTATTNRYNNTNFNNTPLSSVSNLTTGGNASL